MNFIVDGNIKNLLIKAGWSEDRKVNRSALRRMIIENGYTAFHKVLDFLEAFEGIVIKYQKANTGTEGDISFDFEKAAELEIPEKICGDYQMRIGRELCIIGTASKSHLILIMDEDGKVYGGYDNYLIKISDSGIGAIEALVNNIDNKEFVKIP